MMIRITNYQALQKENKNDQQRLPIDLYELF